MANGEDHQLKAFLRICENSAQPKKLFDIDGNEITIKTEDKWETFSFDYVFPPNASQVEVFEQISPGILESFLGGQNTCIFAYGQTGSGKTYSMLGSIENPGLLPRFICKAFDELGNEIYMQKAKLQVSFYELYKEKVYDLFSDTGAPLRIRGTSKIYMEGLVEHKLQSANEFLKLLNIGLARRATAATLFNEKSSRSHAIFHFTLRREVLTNGQLQLTSSHAYFVDLAGSERLTLDGAARLAETAAINCSLLSLQKVIDAKSGGRVAFINYRESVLTRILKDCFGSNSKTAILATVPNEIEQRLQILPTIRFASKARNIVQMPKKNYEIFYNKIADVEPLDDNIQFKNNKDTQWTEIVPPGLIELFSDPALKSFVKLDANEGPLQLGIVETQIMIRISATKENTHILECKIGDATINGDLLVEGSTYLLTHKDIISLNGIRFWVFIDEPISADYSSYYQARLQYVEKTFPVHEKELREASRKEFDKDQREMLAKLNEELAQTKEQLEVWRSARGEDAKKNRELLEQGIQDTEAFSSNLIQATKTQQKIFEQEVVLNSADKDKLVCLKGKIESTKLFIAAFFDKKSWYTIYLNIFTSGAEIANVRLFDRKKRIFADLRISEFEYFYDKFAELYQESGFSTNPSAVCTQAIHRSIETIFFSGTWKWKNYGIGRKSTIFNKTINNIMNDTANARKSTVAMLKKSFSNRKSVVAESLGLVTCNTNEVWSNFIAYLNIISLNFQTNHSSSLIEYVLRSLLEIKDKFAMVLNYNTPEKLTQASDQCPAMFAFHDFNHSINTLREVIFTFSKEALESSNILEEMFKLCNVLFAEKNRWISSIIDNMDAVTKFQKIFDNLIDELYEQTGRLSYFIMQNFPQDSYFEPAAHHFQKGLVNSIETVCKDVKTIHSKYKKCANFQSKIVTTLCRCIAQVFNEIILHPQPTLTFVILPLLLLCKDQSLDEQVKWGDLESNLHEISNELVSNANNIDSIFAVKLRSDLYACRRMIDNNLHVKNNNE